MMRTTLATAFILAAFPSLSCDGGGTETENQPPETVGEIPDHILSRRRDSVMDIAVYFTDPDGDDLTYQATSSVEGILSATMAGSLLTLVSHDRLGGSAVTITASDPDDATAQQSFAVTVRNQPPETVGEIPDQFLSKTSDLVVDIAVYFTDPDGDDLTYQATSSVEGILSATMAGSLLTLVSHDRLGGSVVTITASDPDDATAQQSFEALVTDLSFRDDFDSDNSLDDWTMVDVESLYISDSVLHVEVTEVFTLGHAHHDLAAPLTDGWTVKTSMGLADGGLCTDVIVFTGDSAYPAWAFDIDHGFDEWNLLAQTAERDNWWIVENGEDDESINYEEGELTAITMSFADSKIWVWAEGDLILETDDLTGEMPDGGDPPTDAIAIGLGGNDCDDGGKAMFDWVEIGPSGEARRAGPGPREGRASRRMARERIRRIVYAETILLRPHRWSEGGLDDRVGGGHHGWSRQLR